MSGRHRVVKPRRRFGLATVAAPPRMVWRRAQAGWATVARSWRRLIERATERFDGGDPFAGVHLDPQATSPDPVPAPVVEPEPTPEPLVLAPGQVLAVLHTQRPNLPGPSVQWHVHEAGVHGEVNSLDADEDGQRRTVNAYAAALDAAVVEDVDGPRLLVSTTGLFGGVPVTVAATFVDADTMPLPAYREAAGCLETQHIPDEVLAEAVGA